MLFHTATRSDATPAKPDESRFQFLNRSASSYFAHVRDLIESWLSRVPTQAQADLVGALRGDNREHEAAFWELYLHEAYRRSGFQIKIHPVVPGATTKPDFYLERGSTSFYLEAVSVGQDPKSIAEDRRLHDVHRVLEEMRIDNFIIGLEHFNVGPTALATKPLRAALRDWLITLDPDEVTDNTLKSGYGGFDGFPHFHWEKDGWSLVFEAFPLKADARGQPRRALGVLGPGEASIVDNVTGIRRVLDAKYGKYGALDSPLVIAVQSNTDYPTEDYEAEHALFGVASRRPTDPSRLEGHFFQDGFWLASRGWRRGDCPQIVTMYELAPWRVGKAIPRLWSTLEPGVHGPSQPGWLAPVTVGAQPVPGSSADLALHFDLDPNWLSSEPDFDVS